MCAKVVCTKEFLVYINVGSTGPREDVRLSIVSPFDIMSWKFYEITMTPSHESTVSPFDIMSWMFYEITMTPSHEGVVQFRYGFTHIK